MNMSRTLKTIAERPNIKRLKSKIHFLKKFYLLRGIILLAGFSTISGCSQDSLRFSSARKKENTAYNDKMYSISNEPFSTVTSRVRGPEIQDD